MDDVVLHKVEPLKESKFVRPMQVIYSQDGRAPRKWDYVRVHDSVAILIFNVTLKCVIMVKQFRPAVYMHECHRKQEDESSSGQKEARSVTDVSKDVPPHVAITHELCAGLADKSDKSMKEVAAAEVLEETGYRVAAESLELISRYRSSVGHGGSLQSLFYAEVTEDMKVGQATNNQAYCSEPLNGDGISLMQLEKHDHRTAFGSLRDMQRHSSFNNPVYFVITFCESLIYRRGTRKRIWAYAYFVAVESPG